MRQPGVEILSARGLSFSYGSLLALDDVTLSIREGATGLLGPNGAGKTTLLRLFLGLLPLNKGQIRLFDHAPATVSSEARSLVGYMPESDAMLPGLTGVEMVAYLAKLSGLPRREAISRAHESLHYVGLGEARYRPVDSYSTGMRQRVKLAQALAHGPKLVILDEPTNGLDPHGRDEILALIRDLWQNKGLSVLLSSHLLQDVEATCNSIAVLKAGRLVEERGISGNWDPSASKSGTRDLDLRVQGDLERFQDNLQKLQIRWNRRQDGRLTVTLPGSSKNRELFQAALDSGVQIRQLRPAQTTLEEIFVQAVGD